MALPKGMVGALKALRETDRPGFDAAVRALVPTAPAKAAEPVEATAVPTRASLETQVEAKARAYRDQHPGVTPEQAQAAVWLSEPDLVEAWNAAPAELPTTSCQATEAAEPPTGVMPTQDELRADYLAFAERCGQAASGR